MKKNIKKLTFEEQLEVGTKEESEEHDLSEKEGRKVALDHLKEDRNYYNKLKKAGLMIKNLKKSIGDIVMKSKQAQDRAMQHSNKLGAGAKKRKHLHGKDKAAVVMREFYNGTLHSSDGKIVTDVKQAKAIAMSESGQTKKMKKSGVSLMIRKSSNEIKSIPFMKAIDILKKIKKELDNSLEGIDPENINEIKKYLIYILDLKEKLQKSRDKEPVGTIHTWKNGNKYKKTLSGKWRKIYEGESKGKNISVGKLKSRIQKSNTVEELVNLVSEHYKRFYSNVGKLDKVVDTFLKLAKEKRNLIKPKIFKELVEPKENESKKEEPEFEEKDKLNITGYWNGKVYGNEKYGFRIYVDDREKKVTKGQIKYIIQDRVKKQKEKQEKKEQIQREGGIVKINKKLELGLFTIQQTDENFGVSFNYDPKLVNRIKEIPGRLWDAQHKIWLIPRKSENQLMEFLNKYSGEKESVAQVESIKQKSRPVLFSGYNRPLINTPVRVSKDTVVVYEATGKSTTIDENDPSIYGYELLGHEGERGYFYTYRSATSDEIKQLEEHEKKVREKKELKKLNNEIKSFIIKHIEENGEYPEGSNNPQGKIYLDTFTVYGGGSRFIVNDTEIWYIRNNGGDGDDWGNNNIRTGGAGAIGLKIKYEKDIEDNLKKIEEFEGGN